MGGEGNGGVLLPELHLGRDAPVAAALVLAWLAGPKNAGKTTSEAFASLPRLFMCKLKAALVPGFAAVLERLAREYAEKQPGAVVNREDGLRVDTPEGWIHLRASNTEPVYRVIGEWAVSQEHSLEQCNLLMKRVAQMAKEMEENK